MTNREVLAAWNEDAIVFTEDWYDDAIIGITTDDNVIYDYDKLVEALIEHDKMTWEDAVEWVEYNMIRGAQYMGSGRPMIAYSIESLRKDVK